MPGAAPRTAPDTAQSPRVSTKDGTLLWQICEQRLIPIEMRVVPRARGARLSLNPIKGVICLSHPVRHSQAQIMAFLDAHHDWIASHVASWPCPRPFHPGSVIPINGQDVTIVWDEGLSRTPCLNGDQLCLGGPQDFVATRVDRFLRDMARQHLVAQTTQAATAFDLPLSKIVIGDPQSRWGSCTGRGRIFYSWRLICAPPWVRAATVAHEVAHLRHMNHGPDFWRLAAQILGDDHAPARRWLRENGTALHWVGRPAPQS